MGTSEHDAFLGESARLSILDVRAGLQTERKMELI